MYCNLSWELDRQIVLTQLQNVILALRSSSQFGSKSRFFSSSQQAAEHPLLQGAIDLTNRLLCSPCPAGDGAAAEWPVSALVDGDAPLSTSGSFSANATRRPDGTVPAFSFVSQRALTDTEIFAPFVAVCTNAEASETLVSVAVSGLVAMLERPCAFITAAGLRAALEAAARARSVSPRRSSHEVTMARLTQVYVACLQHPAAAALSEEVYVRAVGRTLVLAVHPGASPLLKRAAENAMRSIVTALFSRVVAMTAAAVGGAPPPHGHLSGTAMMRYISALISGSVSALDVDGNTVAYAEDCHRPSPSGARGSAGAGAGAAAAGGSPSKGTSGATGAGSGSGSGETVVADGGPAIQLEGLWLAQAALFAVSHHINHPTAHRLRVAVQDDLSRALLIAGVGTTHVVVLAQILRTVHLAVKCAAEHLVPQTLSFLRVLHLGPLASLTEELGRAERSSPSSSNGGFFGGGGGGGGGGAGGHRFASPLPPGSPSSSTASPSSPSGNILSSSALVDMYERKEVLLESLTEFCSDPGFLSFIYAHYDLSWHCTSLLPQLCDVLVSNACVGEPAHPLFIGGSGEDRDDARKASNHSGSSSLGRGHHNDYDDEDGDGDDGDSPSSSFFSAHRARPINRLQVVALDAAANMISEMAFRTAASTAVTVGSGRSSSAGATPPQHAPLSPHSHLGGSSEAPETAAVSAAVAQRAIDIITRQKQLLMRFANLFEESAAKKGIPFLLEHAVRVDTAEEEAAAAVTNRTWLVLRNPAGGREIGQALFRLSVLLDKRALGDHIGDLGRERTPKPLPGEMATLKADGTVLTAMDEATATDAGAPATDGSAGEAGRPGDTTTTVPMLELWEKARQGDHLVVGTVRFYEEQLKGFIGMFDFTGKPLLTAIREMVYRLCLPGESQKIDRIMEAFATHWYAQNEGDRVVNPFHSDSGAFVLSFAIIMLNTVFHSKRLDRTLTLADFKGMNRGIDDGNNIPDEYLAAIYEDVGKHEVVMAEMMDRGFANDVTWDLEMNGVKARSFHGVDGTLANMIQLVRSDGDAEGATAAGGDGPQPQRSGAVTSSHGRESVMRVLDPYVFHAVWKRCLMVFSGMVDVAGAQVSRLSPRGSTVQDAVDHIRALMPTELAALLSGLRGIQMLARSAHLLGVPAAVDECALALLSHVRLRLTDPQDVVDALYRSLPKLLCTREIFTLVRCTSSSLTDSWPRFADLVLKLYLLGLFTVAPPPAVADGDGEPHPAAPSEPLPAVLARNPGLAEHYDAAARANGGGNESSSGGGGGGGGWFSALFGGGSAAPAKGGSGRRGSAAEATALGAQPRLRECVPDMAQLLRSLAALPAFARQRLLRALVMNDNRQGRLRGGGSGGGANHPQQQQPLSSQAAFVLSYEMCLATAVVVAPAATAATAATAAVSVGPRRGSDAEPTADVLSTYLLHLRETASAVLSGVAAHTAAAQTTQHGRGHAAAAAPSAAAVKAAGQWRDVGVRVVGGVVEVLQHALLQAYHRRGTAPVELLEIAWGVLEVFLELPPEMFNVVAAKPIGRLFETWALALAEQRPEQRLSTAVEVHVLTPLAAHTASLVGAGTDAGAVAALRSACHTIVSHELYDVATQTQPLLSAALALGMCRGGDGASGAVAGPPPAETIGLCCHHVLRAASSVPAAASDPEAVAAWLGLWTVSLRHLAGLVVCAGTPKAGSEALLALQRALQDTALAAVPATVIGGVYDDVLFPLVERVCAPGRSAAAFAAPAAAPVPPPPPALSSGRHDSGAPDAAAPAVPSHSLLASLFGGPGAANGSSPPSPSQSPSRSGLAPLLSSEVKGRVVNLLPKVLLQYIAALARHPELLQDLWQRVLGTLYAMYTAYPPAPSDGSDGAAAVAVSDEAAVMREAVEETVKNMIYVLSTMLAEGPASALQQVPYLATSTRNLIRPFTFAGPLLRFLDEAEGSAAQAPPLQQQQSQ